MAPTWAGRGLLSLRQTRSDEIFVQFVQLNEYLGNASKLSQRVQFLLFLFSPFDYIEVPLRNIRVERYKRFLDVISKLYFVLVKTRRRSGNRSIHISNLHEQKSTIDVPVLFLYFPVSSRH